MPSPTQPPTSDLPRTGPAVVAHAAGDLRIEEVPLAVPAPDQAVIEVVFGGICGSDLHYWLHGAAGESVLKAPMVLGHEIVGTVVRAAADGTGPAAGTRVAVHPATPGPGTGDVKYPEDRPNLAPGCTYLGSAARYPHTDGAFSRYTNLPARMLRVLPEGLDPKRASLVEPASVAWHAVARAGDVRGKTALVIGSGPIGALAVAVLKRTGAARIVAVDMHPKPLEIAQAVGADEVLEAGEADAIAAVQADVVIESSGSHHGLASAIKGAVRGGKVVMVGLLPTGPQPVLISLAITRELDLLGSFRFNDEIDEVITAMADGSLFVDPVITHIFPLEDGLEAFETARNSAESGKVLLSFAPAGSTAVPQPSSGGAGRMTAAIRPMVVMGVSGSGKSVLGHSLGQSLGIPFIDADDLHPASNKALMAAGTPLTDADRIPWLNVVAETIAKGAGEGQPSVVACSALKRSYRDLLRSHVPDLLLIYIDGEAEIIAQRLQDREHEFMPATLLASQLATLEPAQADEAHIRVPAELTVEEAVELIRSTLDLPSAVPPN